MGLRFQILTINKPLFACCFVFMVSMGFVGKASASCGDYMRHRGTPVVHSIFRIDSQDGQSRESTIPVTGCKHGNCGAVPPSLPLESVRMSRLDANHFAMGFIFEKGIMSAIAAKDDASPIQPALEFPDPPPRSLAPLVRSI